MRKRSRSMRARCVLSPPPRSAAQQESNRASAPDACIRRSALKKNPPPCPAQIGFDFVNGDTLTCIDSSYYAASVAAGNALSFQPEGNSAVYALGWTKSGWGEGWPLCGGGCIPPVDLTKWIEPRHTSAICDRWAGPNTGLKSAPWGTDRSQDLIQALFNGDGFVSWENVWGFCE